MTIIEYAESIGLYLSDNQKEILNMWQKFDFDNKAFALSIQRHQGRQLLIELIQRYKGYQQGQKDAIDEFVAFINTMPTVEEDDGYIRPMTAEEMAEQLKEKNIFNTQKVKEVEIWQKKH